MDREMIAQYCLHYFTKSSNLVAYKVSALYDWKGKVSGPTRRYQLVIL